MSNSDSIFGSGVTIGGTAGGAMVLLLMIIILICIVILCVRRCNASPVDNKTFNNTTNLNTNINMEINPAYDVTKANAEDYLYSKPGDSDVPITTYPSDGIPARLCSNTSEDEYGYVLPTKLNQHPEGVIKMTTNPSYGISTGNRIQQEEYGGVNQPGCNDNDYEITPDITIYQSTN